MSKIQTIQDLKDLIEELESWAEVKLVIHKSNGTKVETELHLIGDYSGDPVVYFEVNLNE
jgi:hypothetical protein